VDRHLARRRGARRRADDQQQQSTRGRQAVVRAPRQRSAATDNATRQGVQHGAPETLPGGQRHRAPLIPVRRRCRAYAGRTSSPRAYGDVVLWKTPRLRSVSRLYTAAGSGGDQNMWKPALAENRGCSRPRVHRRGTRRRPLHSVRASVPTPFPGAVYILKRERVHLVDIPFTEAIQSVSRWGAGSKELVAAVRREALRDAMPKRLLEDPDGCCGWCKPAEPRPGASTDTTTASCFAPGSDLTLTDQCRPPPTN